MLDFMERYPQSQHANRMRFMLACYYAEENNLEAAKEHLLKVDYMGLNAREKERYDIRMGYIRFVDACAGAGYGRLCIKLCIYR